ncbi:DNA-processing protein DprA [Reinekea marinisedimentorum]|uniref:DNA processing protein n=1 Tax=Reinekea marinisedimentorum TaxID=230495 RepID=A0A4R3IFX3_9GAMM|nr:DNA-processing protein DprA [Reinekea marinisedimentorum]TCS43892.1 DNA processing protein [Reinekea marinisedimentorum]
MPTNPLAWLRWVLIPNFGLKKCHDLLNYIDSPESLFLHPDRWPLSASVRRTVLEMNHLGEQHPVHRRALQQLEWAEQPGHCLVSIEDDAYPHTFQALVDAPLLIWGKGNPDVLNNKQIGIVGSRAASANALRHTANISACLAGNGLTITSGGATGVDSASHQAALDAQGKTIAVLGCGVDIVYPKHNRQLFDSISRNGMVISEYPLGTQPKPGHFPRRNRIISALSEAIIVIEAGLKSGTLTTAQHALEQGKDIFVLPGDIANPNNAGSHKLIQEGAFLLAEPRDVLEFLHMKPDFNLAAQQADLSHLSPLQQQILATLQIEPKPLEGLAHDLSEPMHQLLEPILELELEGLIEQHPGGYALSSLL